MPNDFLTSLSLRAVQNPGMNSLPGVLGPRLASRFESSITSGLPATDEIQDIESSATIEAKQRPRISSPVVERNKAAEETIPSIQLEGPQTGRVVPPALRRDESAQIVSRESPLTPDHA